MTQAINEHFPVRFSLIFGSLLVILLVGVALGVFSAVRGGIVGRLMEALSPLGFSLPGFWVGAVLIAVFAVEFRAFPAVAYVSNRD